MQRYAKKNNVSQKTTILLYFVKSRCFRADGVFLFKCLDFNHIGIQPKRMGENVIKASKWIKKSGKWRANGYNALLLLRFITRAMVKKKDWMKRRHGGRHSPSFQLTFVRWGSAPAVRSARPTLSVRPLNRS